MGLIDIASNNSTWRGLEYYKKNRVINYSKVNDNQYEGVVSNSNGKKYDVFMDIEHPRKSKCNCSHAKDRRIICKHIVALYFTVFPDEVQKFLKEVEEAEKEYEEYEKEIEEKLIKYVNSMSKNELRQTVLELLYDGPEWMYDRFIRENIEY